VESALTRTGGAGDAKPTSGATSTAAATVLDVIIDPGAYRPLEAMVADLNAGGSGLGAAGASAMAVAGAGEGEGGGDAGGASAGEEAEASMPTLRTGVSFAPVPAPTPTPAPAAVPAVTSTGRVVAVLEVLSLSASTEGDFGGPSGRTAAAAAAGGAGARGGRDGGSSGDDTDSDGSGDDGGAPGGSKSVLVPPTAGAGAGDGGLAKRGGAGDGMAAASAGPGEEDLTGAAAKGTGMVVRRVAQPGRRLACATCGAAFDDSAAHREHARSQWHRYNLKRKTRGMGSVPEAEFERLPAPEVTAFLESYD